MRLRSIQSQTVPTEAFELYVSGLQYISTNGTRAHTVPLPGPKLAKRSGPDIDMNVHSVQERPGHLGQVAFDLIGRAATALRFRAVVAAGAGIQGRHTDELSRIGDRSFGPGHGIRAVFQGLAYHLEHVTRKLGKLIQE